MHPSKIHTLKYIGEHDMLWTSAYGVISLSCSAETQNSKEIFEEKETKKKKRKKERKKKRRMQLEKESLKRSTMS